MKKDKKKLKYKNLKHQIPDNIESPNVIKETNLHYPIKLSIKQSLKTFFSPILRQTDESLLLKKLRKQGTDRIEKDLSIENLVKHVRDSKIFIK